MGEENRIEWWRVLKIAVALVVSAFVGYRFQPMVSNNPDAVNTVVTIFSILAGFLIAVITFVAEPVLKQAKNWKELQLMKKTVRRQLLRQKFLFFLYLMTLGMALSMYLTPPDMVDLLIWLQVVFLGLSTFVFLASFSLPGSLMRVQMERYEAALGASRPTVLAKAEKAADQARRRP